MTSGIASTTFLHAVDESRDGPCRSLLRHAQRRPGRVSPQGRWQRNAAAATRLRCDHRPRSLSRVLCRTRGHQRGIQTTRQQYPVGHITHQLTMHGLLQTLAASPSAKPPCPVLPHTHARACDTSAAHRHHDCHTHAQAEIRPHRRTHRPAPSFPKRHAHDRHRHAPSTRDRRQTDRAQSDSVALPDPTGQRQKCH